MNHIQQSSLSLTVQLMHLQRLFLEGKGEVRRDRLTWTQMIQPHCLAHSYTCRFEFAHRNYPVVYCLDPQLSKLAKGRTLPHVRRSAEPVQMCLFVYSPDCWNDNMIMADVVVPLAFYWLSNFEEWLYSGEWRGGGTHEITPDVPAGLPDFAGASLVLTKPTKFPAKAPELGDILERRSA